MKKNILILATLCITVIAGAQKYQDALLYGENKNRIDVFTLLGIPNDTFAIPSFPQDKRRKPHIAAKGNTIYLWDTTLYKWSAYLPGGGGSQGLQDVITFNNNLTTHNNIQANGHGLWIDSLEYFRLYGDDIYSGIPIFDMDGLNGRLKIGGPTTNFFAEINGASLTLENTGNTYFKVSDYGSGDKTNYALTLTNTSNALVGWQRVLLPGDTAAMLHGLYDMFNVRNSLVKLDTGKIITNNAADSLIIPTYEGSGQAIHPDVYYNSKGWNGYKYWMAFTPYANGVDTVENPSIVVSHDGENWIVPPGVTNPLVPRPTGLGSFNYNADPDLVEGYDGKLYMFYIDGTTDVWVISSSNGVAWSSPLKIIDMSVQTIISPAVILDSGVYRMYYIDAAENPNILKYRTATTPTGTWSAPTTCAVSPIPSGKDIWHINVSKEKDEYHLIVTTSLSGSHTDNNLHFATSSNGVDFAMTSSPVMIPSVTPNKWDNNRIYRASLIKVDEGHGWYYKLFYSAANTAGAWGTGVTKLWPAKHIRNISPKDDRAIIASENGTAMLHIDSLKRVGINNANPTEQLHVSGNILVNDAVIKIDGTATTQNPYIMSYVTTPNNFRNGGWQHYMNGTLQWIMAFSNSGEFGGTSGANSGKFWGLYDNGWKLGFNNNGDMYLGPNSTAYGVKLSTSGTNYFNNEVGIKTLSPTHELDVTGTIRVTDTINSEGLFRYTQSPTTVKPYFAMFDANGILYKVDTSLVGTGGGSGSQGLQDVITTNPSLTTNNVINVKGNTLTLDSIGTFYAWRKGNPYESIFQLAENGFTAYSNEKTSNQFFIVKTLALEREVRLEAIDEDFERASTIRVKVDTIFMDANFGNYFYDSLQHSNSVTDKMVVWDSVTNKIATRAIPSGGSGTPAGSDRQIQFNNAGSFGAHSTFLWNANNELQIGSGTDKGAYGMQVTSNESIFESVSGTAYIRLKSSTHTGTISEDASGQMSLDGSSTTLIKSGNVIGLQVYNGKVMVGNGGGTATAWHAMRAGTTTVPPLEFTLSGAALKTSPLAGAMEALVDSLYYTGNAAVRDKIVLGNLKQTLTNKRITKRAGTTASTSSLTIDSDSYDVYTITALAANLTINNPSGTPTEGQTILIRIKDNGTSRTLTWSGSQFRSIGITLPAATTANKTIYVGGVWNAIDSKWDMVSLNEEI